MNELQQYFERNQNRLMNKFEHYFEIYDRYFHSYKNKPVTIVEIGVSHGGSLEMWREYFGDQATIWGIDIDPRCKSLEGKNIHILIGSQEDKKFLRSIAQNTGPIDILIDDGGHTQNQQKVSFEILFEHVKPNGVYLCEDTHTSYWNVYGGGYKRMGSFIEFSKHLIDQLNAFHSEQNALRVNSFTTTACSVHYYDSVVVIEKRKREKPFPRMTGNPSFEYAPGKKTLFEKLSLIFLKNSNKFLQIFHLPGFGVNKMIELSGKK